MKRRKGYRITWEDGTTWDGDCPEWAASARRAGIKVTTFVIVGSSRWNCSACELRLTH